jgi:hypothetical protein
MPFYIKILLYFALIFEIELTDNFTYLTQAGRGGLFSSLKTDI